MAKLGELISQIDGRLTLTSGVPVTTSDVTAATTIYFTPYKGNHIALYNEDFEDWRLHNFTELSYSLAGIAADTNFDVFIYNNAGTLSLEIVAWSGATTRATVLAVQDGVYVKSGEPAKRYLGTFRTTSTIGQCEDSEAKRFCWNLYNQVGRDLLVEEDTNHTYAISTWRYWNNDSSVKVEMVIGIILEKPTAAYHCQEYNASGTCAVCIGLDTSASVYADAPILQTASTSWISLGGECLAGMSIGYHYITLIEYRFTGTGNYIYGKLAVTIQG